MPINNIENPCQTSWQAKWLKMDCHHPSIQSMADDVEDFCGRFFRGRFEKTLLVLCGRTGTGKTHVAKQVVKWADHVAREAYDQGNWPRGEIPGRFYVSWPLVVSQFMEKEFGVMDDLIHSALVVLDDLGAENDPFSIGKDKLCQILTSRENKFTIVTTNIMPESWDERFDARISDRLLRNSVVKILLCDSYSQKTYAKKDKH